MHFVAYLVGIVISGVFLELYLLSNVLSGSRPISHRNSLLSLPFLLRKLCFLFSHSIQMILTSPPTRYLLMRLPLHWLLRRLIFILH